MPDRMRLLTRWRFHCPQLCGYSIDVASDSGKGEEAANLMDVHMQDEHESRFPEWRRGKEPSDA